MILKKLPEKRQHPDNKRAHKYDPEDQEEDRKRRVTKKLRVAIQASPPRLAAKLKNPG
jgi:hypothetical protein